MAEFAPMHYRPEAWYWQVRNKPGQVFSSAGAAYVDPTSDADYLAWTAQLYLPSNILCDGELAYVLLTAELPEATVLACGATDYGGLTPDQIDELVAIGLPAPAQHQG